MGCEHLKRLPWPLILLILWLITSAILMLSGHIHGDSSDEYQPEYDLAPE